VNYTVIWKPAAHAELTELWLEASNRSDLTSAANKIDQLLKRDPHSQGESRSGSIRVMFVDPVGVFFDIREQDRIVAVLSVWRVA
jgi:hypothetical protein